MHNAGLKFLAMAGRLRVMHSTLSQIHADVLRLSNPLAQVARQAKALGNAADRLHEDALTSGAMDQDFRVMLMFKRRPPPAFGSQMVAVLVWPCLNTHSSCL